MTLGDLVTVARVLLAQAPGARDALCAQIFAQAQAAERWRCATGRGHPEWGNGSVTSAALRHGPAREPARLSEEYCEALMLVLRQMKGGAGHM